MADGNGSDIRLGKDAKVALQDTDGLLTMARRAGTTPEELEVFYLGLVHKAATAGDTDCLQEMQDRLAARKLQLHRCKSPEARAKKILRGVSHGWLRPELGTQLMTLLEKVERISVVEKGLKEMRGVVAGTAIRYRGEEDAE